MSATYETFPANMQGELVECWTEETLVPAEVILTTRDREVLRGVLAQPHKYTYGLPQIAADRLKQMDFVDRMYAGEYPMRELELILNDRSANLNKVRDVRIYLIGVASNNEEVQKYCGPKPSPSVEKAAKNRLSELRILSDIAAGAYTRDNLEIMRFSNEFSSQFRKEVGEYLNLSVPRKQKKTASRRRK